MFLWIFANSMVDFIGLIKSFWSQWYDLHSLFQDCKGTCLVFNCFYLAWFRHQQGFREQNPHGCRDVLWMYMDAKMYLYFEKMNTPVPNLHSLNSWKGCMYELHNLSCIICQVCFQVPGGEGWQNCPSTLSGNPPPNHHSSPWAIVLPLF